jgi:hypothetical protein
MLVGSVATLVITVALLHTVRPSGSARVGRSILWSVGAFVLTLALSVAPQLWGGLPFSVLRGNGSDSFNYVTAANYLDHEPFSWASHVDPQTLVNRDQSYQRAEELLGARWGTYMMLAFSSRVAQVPPYVFEYCFSLLCLLISFAPAFLYARSLALRPAYAVLTAGAICVGFWAQIILDTRAQSQLNSIPVLLLIMLLISRLQNRLAGRASWGEYALLGLCVAALAFLYIEITPLAVLALLLFASSYIRSGRSAWPAGLGYLLAAVLALLATSPQWPLLFNFASGQFAFAASAPLSWHLAYYRWFYLNPMAGFWGFGPMESESPP